MPANRTGKDPYKDPLYIKNKAQVLKDHGHTCYLCGREATTADHIIPVSLGGGNEYSNLLPACLECNSRRGNRMESRHDFYSRELLTHI